MLFRSERKKKKSQIHSPQTYCSLADNDQMEEELFGAEDSDQMPMEGEYMDPITLLSHQEDELSQKSSAGSQNFSQKSSSGSEKLSQKSSTDPEQGHEEDKEVECYNSDDETTLALLKEEEQLCFEEEVFSDDLTGVQLYNESGYPDRKSTRLNSSHAQ